MADVRKPLFISVAVTGLLAGVALPVIAPMTRALGLSESQGGMMLSASSIAFVLGAGFWGRYSDKVGRKPVILYGMIGIFLAYSLYTLAMWAGLMRAMTGAGLFAVLVLARFAFGLAWPAITSASLALIADTTSKEERSSGTALIGAAQGVGMVIGPAIGGALAMISIIAPFVFASVLPLLGYAYTRAALPVTNLPERSEKPSRPSVFSGQLWVWLVASVALLVMILTAQITVGFYVQDSLGLSNEQTTMVLAAGLTIVGIVLVITQIIQAKFLHLAPRPMILIGSAFSVLSFLILIQTNAVLPYLLAYGMAGIAAGFLFPAVTAGASLSVSADQQGTVAGMVQAAQGVGMVIGPAISTFAYEINPTLPFWGVIVMMACVGLLVAVVVRSPKQRSETADAQPG